MNFSGRIQRFCEKHSKLRRHHLYTFSTDHILVFIFQVRLPPNTSDDVDEDPTGNKALWDRGLLNGASQKVEVSSTLITQLSHRSRKDHWH